MYSGHPFGRIPCVCKRDSVFQTRENRKLLQVGIFIGKLLLFMGLFIWVRWMLPRFRSDQLMDIGWKRFVPLALANIIVTAIGPYLLNAE